MKGTEKVEWEGVLVNENDLSLGCASVARKSLDSD